MNQKIVFQLCLMTICMTCIFLSPYGTQLPHYYQSKLVHPLPGDVEEVIVHENRTFLVDTHGNGKKYQPFSFDHIPSYPTGMLSKATVVRDKCANSQTSLSKENRTHFALITTIVLPTRASYNLTFNNKRKPTAEETQVRAMEILNTLQSNLDNNLFSCVHALVKTSDDAKLLQQKQFRNSHKLFIKIGGIITQKFAFSYATDCLKDHYVALTNQDISFGKGWEKLNFDLLRKRKVMYSLTRHTSKKNCLFSNIDASCNIKGKYWGSHDTYVFHTKEHIPEKKLKVLAQSSVWQLGVENNVMWTFKHEMGYTVLNPCKILVTHHEHCIPIRQKRRTRVKVLKGTLVGPSENLS